MNSDKQTTTWPQLAEGLYGMLTGRGATIEYHFENMQIAVPSSTLADQTSANWKLNGTIKIKTSEPK